MHLSEPTFLLTATKQNLKNGGMGKERYNPSLLNKRDAYVCFNVRESTYRVLSFFFVISRVLTHMLVTK